MRLRATLAVLMLLLPASTAAAQFAEAIFCACREAPQAQAMACCAEEAEPAAAWTDGCCCEIQAPADRSPAPASPRVQESEEPPAPITACKDVVAPATATPGSLARVRPQGPRAPPRPLHLLHASFLC